MSLCKNMYTFLFHISLTKNQFQYALHLETRLTGDYRGRTYSDRHGTASLDTHA